MKSLCERFNRAIDSVVALVGVRKRNCLVSLCLPSSHLIFIRKYFFILYFIILVRYCLFRMHPFIL